MYIKLILTCNGEIWTLVKGDDRKWKQRVQRIFESKRDVIVIGWRKCHSEVVCNSFSSPNCNYDDKEDEMGKACNPHEKGVYKVLVQLKEIRQIGEPRYRWDDTTVMDLREIGFLWFRKLVSGGLL